jgi:glycosyltransferase involved in cell wall biosynthesis
MQIAIYNRWASIAGGGERHACALAQALARRHEVTLLTLRPFDRDGLAQQLGLDLSNVAIQTLPDSAGARLIAARSAQYDLFINASHGELFVPLAPRNALLVFFPQILPQPGPLGPLQLAAGFYPLEGAPATPFRWSDGQGVLRLGAMPPRAQLRLTLRGAQPPGWPPLAVTLRDGAEAPIDRRILPLDRPLDWLVPLPPALRQHGGVLCIESSYFVPAQIGLNAADQRALGVQLLAAELVTPGWGRRRRLAGGSAALLDTSDRSWEALAAYQLVLANSRYTQSWIARRWGRQSQLLYPPVAVEQLAPGSKQPQILSVGRFFTGLHSKGQFELAHAFAQLCDTGLRGWRLILAGRVDSTQPEHLAYLDRVRAAARGYPVEVIPNADTARLRDLYARSSLYWHAAGLGADTAHAPERCEHFGISLVEAMAAGCVPLAYACGGPAELVEHTLNGYLWRDTSELARYTRALVHDEATRQTLAQAALTRSTAFGWDAFARQVEKVVA